jgi:hypothetical protein
MLLSLVMKGCAFCLLAVFVVVMSASARIGDTPAQLKERYGEPIAESTDKDGNGLQIYRTTQFKEIRVTLVAGKSQMEKYRAAEAVGDPKAIFIALREENPRQFGSERSEGQLQIGTDESGSELKFVRSTGRRSTHSGVLEVRTKDKESWAVLRDKGSVLEIPMTLPEVNALRPGLKCKATVLDQIPDDLWTPIVWVGKREHLDSDDAISDVHDSLQLLVKVESTRTILFDRSICSVHHRAMKLRKVPIAYGMLIWTKAERYCNEHFPHFREFAVGGCLVGEKQSTRIYVCSDCVAACKEYSRLYGEAEKTNQ